MARKRSQPPNEGSVVEATPEGHASLVAEIERPVGVLTAPSEPAAPITGELADMLGGMSPADYTDAVYESLQDVLGEHDVYTVAHMLDRSVGEMLAVMADAEGPRAAQWAALGLAETIMPYVDPHTKTISVPYKRLRKP